MTKPLILIVDDEVGVRELLTDALRLSDFETLEAKDGMTALTLMRKHKPDLMIIDVNMPVMDGFEFLERVRSKSDNTPAIMLTARKDRADVTRGLRLGADDYISKPFGLEELALRVQAVLRRSMRIEEEFSILTCGPISLNEQTYEVLLDSEQVELSKTEFRLLHHLLLNKGRVMTKANILSEVWEIDFQADSGVVDTYISYLRRKFHSETFEGIKTVRGIGFQIVEPKGKS
ncbi:MAG: response regulator transcription factor [Actinobacteria bacterium]|nr:response regulator transcription factor [Actinomycetota bacterium]